MEIRPLRAEEPAIREFVEELWLPYHRELERIVEAHELDDSVALVDEEIAFRREWLDETDHRLWIARRNGELAGFVATELHSAPSVFDQPDRLLIGDLFVREGYRGAGLARRLVERAGEEARALGCTELELDVDVDNERAIAVYETLGFEPYRRTLTMPIEEP